MVALLNALLVTVFLVNLFMLGTSRIRALIHAAALQGVVLGLMPIVIEGHVSAATALIGVATMIMKGSLIPRMLLKALREAHIKREVEPLVGFVPTMLLGALGTAVSIGLAARLPLSDIPGQSLIVSAAFSTLVSGFLLLTLRFKAITQVIGYLVLENGVFIFGLLLIETMPLVVELGVLLDVFVGVFVISIIIHHINREFASLDTRRLSALKD